MLRSPPTPRMDIPISMEAYHQLLGAASSTGYQKEHWEIAAEAIHEWVRRHDPDALAMPAATGYQWKRVFLPAGTLLRTVFGEKNFHCLVEGDRILYNGQPVSPSGFVNAVGGIRRNAWLCTWILFPDTKEWKLADDLRTRERPRRVRKQALASEPAPATRSAGPREFAGVAPGNEQSPAEMEGIVASASESQREQHAVHVEVPGNYASGEGRGQRQRADIPLSPHRFMDAAERRTNGDERVAALLRHELLPLLYRLCGLDGRHLQARASYGA